MKISNMEVEREGVKFKILEAEKMEYAEAVIVNMIATGAHDNKHVISASAMGGEEAVLAHVIRVEGEPT